MVSYGNSDVVQCLRQYDMFANSLRLIRNNEEKVMIVKQLTKLESKILSLTNEIYEEEYQTLANKECGLLEDEKNRVNMLIDLINQRLTYVEKRCNNHYVLTGETIDAPNVLGADTLDMLEDRGKVIDKYSKNVKLAMELSDDIKSLSSKISLASEKIEINKSLNEELEATFVNVIDNALNSLNLYSLEDSRDEIEYAYYETEKSLRMAESNLEAAKTSPVNVLTDCENMLASIKEDYVKYKEQISILKLIDTFKNEVVDYDSLLQKRQDINEIIKYINNREFLDMVDETVTNQFNTILMEQQDVNTFNDLVLEKERKTNALDEIDEENNSERFQSVLKVLIENEKKRQEKILEEQRRIEEIEKQKRLEIERKKQEEILKRQRIIEEARKKEIEKRTKQLLEEQQNSVLQAKRKTPSVSFDEMKDDSLKEEKIVEETPKIVPEEHKELNFATLNSELKINQAKQEEDEIKDNIFQDKSKIEEELFEEFNKTKDEKVDDGKKEAVRDNFFDEINLNDDNDINFFDRVDVEKQDTKEEKEPNNAFPDMSIDEYMRQFNEKDVDKVDNIFSEDEFPTIPM